MHYRPDQILIHDIRTSVKPGEIPTLNLPIKSIPSSTTSVPRPSMLSLQLKRQQSIELSTSTSTASCYKTFDEFKNRVSMIKLPSSWNLSITEKQIVFTCTDDIHIVPIFEIYADETLTFYIRAYLWKLPINHIIYTEYSQSLNKYYCFKSSKFLSLGSSTSFIQHSTLLRETKYYRSSSCRIMVKTKSMYVDCIQFEGKDKKHTKRKAAKLATPAKLNAHVKFTSPERLKLTIQGYRLQNKSLTDQLVEMRNEIKKHSLAVTNGFNKDFISIMSNADKSKLPQFYEIILGGTTKVSACYQNWSSLPSNDY